MTDQRSGDPHPDTLPEDQPEAHPDSPPAARDDVARDDVETGAGSRGDAIENGVAAEPHDADTRFSDPDGGDEATIDPRVNRSCQHPAAHVLPDVAAHRRYFACLISTGISRT